MAFILADPTRFKRFQRGRATWPTKLLNAGLQIHNLTNSACLIRLGSGAPRGPQLPAAVPSRARGPLPSGCAGPHAHVAVVLHAGGTAHLIDPCASDV